MEVRKLKDMYNGWFVGDFEPSVLKTTNAEVAIKQYFAGDYEKSHYHKIATEITVIDSGKALMNGVECDKGDIIIINPGESTDFRCIEGCTTVVVKVPGVKNDKYLVENDL